MDVAWGQILSSGVKTAAILLSFVLLVHLVPYSLDRLRLKSYPGPLLASLSDLWLCWYSARGKMVRAVWDAHRLYGELRRSTPVSPLPHCARRPCRSHRTEPHLYSRCFRPADCLRSQRRDFKGGPLRRLQSFRQGNAIYNEISRRARSQAEDCCSYVRPEDGPRIRTHYSAIYTNCSQAMGKHMRCG